MHHTRGISWVCVRNVVSNLRHFFILARVLPLFGLTIFGVDDHKEGEVVDGKKHHHNRRALTWSRSPCSMICTLLLLSSSSSATQGHYELMLVIESKEYEDFLPQSQVFPQQTQQGLSAVAQRSDSVGP